jgi:hypothetical protein
VFCCVALHILTVHCWKSGCYYWCRLNGIGLIFLLFDLEYWGYCKCEIYLNTHLNQLHVLSAGDGESVVTVSFCLYPCSILSVLQDVTNHSLTVFWFYQSDTAGVKVPELDLELASGTLGGIVTTVEGLVTKISESEYYYYISHLFQSSYHFINALVFVFNFCSNFFSPYILHLTQYWSLLHWNRPSTSPVPSRDMNNDPVVFTSYCNFFVGQTTDHNTSLQLSFQILYYEYHICSYNVCILYYCLASPVN